MLLKAIDASFLASFPRVDGFPLDAVPEYVFAGVSNSGKSSLINAILKRRDLCRAGKTPGKTKLFNLFDVGFRGWLADEETEESKFELAARFVDCPGSGYAKVGKSDRRIWADNLEKYLDTRRNVVALVEIADARRLIDEDTKVIFPHHHFKIFLIANKVDKLNQSETSRLNNLAAKWDKGKIGRVFLTSATAVEDRGVAKLREALIQLAMGG